MRAHHLKNGRTRFYYGHHSADFANPDNLGDDDLFTAVRLEAMKDRATLEQFAEDQNLDPLKVETAKTYARIHNQTKRLRKLLGGHI